MPVIRFGRVISSSPSAVEAINAIETALGLQPPSAPADLAATAALSAVMRDGPDVARRGLEAARRTRIEFDGGSRRERRHRQPAGEAARPRMQREGRGARPPVPDAHRYWIRRRP